MSSKDKKADAELGAYGAIPQAAWYRLDITGTSANIASLPAGRYIVVLDGVTSAALSSGGAITEPASGSAVAQTSSVVQTGWQYTHPATGVCHVVALNAGSGRAYLVPCP